MVASVGDRWLNSSLDWSAFLRLLLWEYNRCHPRRVPNSSPQGAFVWVSTSEMRCLQLKMLLELRAASPWISPKNWRGALTCRLRLSATTLLGGWQMARQPERGMWRSLAS